MRLARVARVATAWATAAGGDAGVGENIEILGVVVIRGDGRFGPGLSKYPRTPSPGRQKDVDGK
jgi:hypothetical protein